MLTGISVPFPIAKPALELDRVRPIDNHYVRDPTFYWRDGDCVIVVENTIFKIHRFLLAKSAVFADLLKLPNGTSATNLMTEQDPLVLPDKVQEFRALCWALDINPMEAQDQNNSVSFKCRTFFDLLAISHKYQFDSHQKWAARMLLKHFTALENGKNHFLDDETLFKNSELEAITRLFARVKHPKLREAVEQSYMRRFKSNSPPPIPRSLALAEELELRSLQGLIYYHMITSRGPFQHPLSTAYALPSNDLTDAQARNFYRGSYSLSIYWMGRPKVWRTTELPRSIICSRENHAQCQTEWRALWFAYRLEHNLGGLPVTSGPLEKLEALLKLHCSYHQVCIADMLSSLIEELRNTLADHFLGK